MIKSLTYDFIFKTLEINFIYKIKLFTESREYFFRNFVFHFLRIND